MVKNNTCRRLKRTIFRLHIWKKTFYNYLCHRHVALACTRRSYEQYLSKEITTARIRNHTVVGALIFWPVSFTLPATFRACGDARSCMIISILSMWIFRIGFSYIIGEVMGMGAFGIWVAMVIDWVFRCILFVIRYFRGTWKKQAFV